MLFSSKGPNMSSSLSHPSISNLQQSAPPIPPRNNQPTTSYTPQPYGLSTPFNSYSGINNSYYGSGMYSQSPFGSSSYGLGSYNSANTFLRAAEENSRGAFQSIESVVHAFSAVSAMFESTYYAVYNSFRAVVGVADQFYRLKTHLSSILSALAVIRMLKYLYRRCLRLLRMSTSVLTNRPLDSCADDGVWAEAKVLNDSERLVKETNKSNTNWPLIMFLAVVLGGPWLIWKILSSVESSKDDTLWMTGKIDHFIAVSEYDFDTVNNDELSFRKGTRIIIAPKGKL